MNEFMWKCFFIIILLVGWRDLYADDLFPEKRIITSSASQVVAVFAIDLDGDLDIDVLSSSFGNRTVA